MKFLIIHQNFPGQYRELTDWLIAQGGHQIVALAQRLDPRDGKGLRSIVYKRPEGFRPSNSGLLNHFDESVTNGHAAMLACERLKAEGFRPDIILGHSGWGELSFLRHVWRDVPVIGFFELQLPEWGGQTPPNVLDFDPEFPIGRDSRLGFAVRNGLNFMATEVCDLGQTPTQFQASSFPASIRDKLYVCHDGIRTDRLTPSDTASFRLGRVPQPVTAADEVVTYVSRNLEPLRGFHKFMRALPQILEARPNVRVVIAGGESGSYMGASRHPKGFRAQFLEEMGGAIDLERVHFLGRVPYVALVEMMRVTACHIYMTMPFVLSWSMMEAMALGAPMVASDTAPVREMIDEGVEGRLFDFHDPDALAARVIETLEDRAGSREMGLRARHRIVGQHDFLTRALPTHLERINSLVPRARRISPP